MSYISLTLKIQRDAQEALRSHHLQLATAVLDHSNALIYIKNLNLEYILVNQFALHLFHFKEADVIGKTDYHLFSHDVAKKNERSDLIVLNQKVTIREETRVDLRGKQHTLYTVKTPLKDAKGHIYALCGIGTDISELKNAQKLLNDYLEKLEGITTELMEARIISEQANKSKSTFLANMSHELRTPLNSIIGNISLLFNTDVSDVQQKYLARMRISANILIEIINQVLDFSKIAAGEIKLSNESFNLLNVIHACYDILISKAEEKQLRLHLKLPDELIPEIYGDAIRLQQVILNLCGNAIKFTDKGHVEMIASVLHKTSSQIFIQFQIKDTGIGISQEKLSHMFEKFWQADASNTRKFGGTGLGLAISKELVDLMKGNIQVESLENKGTTFKLTIPFFIATESKIGNM